MGYSNQISANSSTAQQLGVGISTAKATVENITGGLTPPAAYVLGVNDGSTPSAATVVGNGAKLTVGGQPLVLQDDQYIDLDTYWVATSSGTADVRVIE